MTKVLVLSTDQSLRKMVLLSLKYNGFSVHFADNSTSAWKLLKEIYFDLIMVDFQLHEESGLAFYKSLRQLGAPIPVLMMGEGDFDEFMLKDLSTEFYGHIIKPFKFRELRSKINQLLSGPEKMESLVSIGELRVDLRRGMISLRDKMFHLGKMELEILLLLGRKAGEVVDPLKIKLLLEREGHTYHETTLFYINRLRTKLKHIAGDAFEINLILNQGYRLELRS